MYIPLAEYLSRQILSRTMELLENIQKPEHQLLG